MSSSSSTAGKKKQQDEQNLKVLRELVALLPNKQCFDCHQRGPTYVNVTIGSFVCTSCSGLLRGLNPPHRVKSISMATFTTDEIEFLKSRGNEYCRRVWLGRYDRGGRGPLEDGAAKDDTQMKDYLVLKYEKKRWYVNPTEAFANSPPPVQKIPAPSQNNNNVTASSTSGTQAAAHRSHSTGTVTSPLSIQNPPPAQSRPSPQQPNSSQDLFARNPVSAAPAPASSADILFDPFGTSAGFGSSMSSPSGPAHSQTASSNGVFQGLQPSSGLVDASSVPKSATVPAGFLVPSGTSQLQPMSVNQSHAQHQQPQPPKPGQSDCDRYSALAELDDLFRSTSPVDAGLGAARQPPLTSAGAVGAFPPLSTTSSNFYQARPPAPVTVTAANPFATASTAPTGNFFGGASKPVPSASMGSNAFGYFPSAGVGTSSTTMQQGYRPATQQFPQQPQMTPMPPMNPFAGQAAAPRPATGAASWNPFL